MNAQTITRDEFNNKNGIKPLTDEDIRRIAPSVFASAPHESRSQRYVHISTVNLLEAFRKEGFEPYSAKQNKSRKSDKTGFVKHMIRFRRSDVLPEKVQVGAAIPEIILINAHDGSSRYKLHGGMFRFACLNGLVIADKTVGQISIGHTGNVIPKVLASAEQILKDVGRTIDVQKEWSELLLSQEEQLAFAKAAHSIRWASDKDLTRGAGIEPVAFLKPRRTQDEAKDLWTVFNVVQENALRGGIEGHTAPRTTEQGWINGRRVVSREVRNIDQSLALNKQLWALAEQTAERIA